MHTHLGPAAAVPPTAVPLFDTAEAEPAIAAGAGANAKPSARPKASARPRLKAKTSAKTSARAEPAPDRYEDFLDRVAEGTDIAAAARAVGVSLRQLDAQRTHDAAFAAAWAAATRLAAELMESILVARVINGVEVTRTFANGTTTTRREFSATLAVKMLARIGARPAVPIARPPPNAAAVEAMRGVLRDLGGAAAADPTPEAVENCPDADPAARRPAAAARDLGAAQQRPAPVRDDGLPARIHVRGAVRTLGRAASGATPAFG